MRLILVRHGETQMNKTGRFQGINDEPLNATGRAQAQAVASALEEGLPFHLYVSPVHRAMETAQTVADKLDVPLTQKKGLEEADIGELEGLTGPEMRERYPDFVKRWTEDAGVAQMPGGESLSQVQERAWKAITELIAKHTDETVVAVTHNFTLQTIVSKVLEMPLRNSRRLRQDLGSITCVEFTNSRTTLLSLNETWHLRSLD